MRGGREEEMRGKENKGQVERGGEGPGVGQKRQ